MIALVGDGGFAMTATEMRIASALGVPVTVVVFADGSLNRIELRQQAMGYPPTGTRLGGTDLAALAEAMDCDGVRVEGPRPAWRRPWPAWDPVGGGPAAGHRGPVDPAQYEVQF